MVFLRTWGQRTKQGSIKFNSYKETFGSGNKTEKMASEKLGHLKNHRPQQTKGQQNS